MTDHNSSNTGSNNSSNTHSDYTDQKLSDLYQQAPAARSPQGLDDTILARASVQAERLRQQPRDERRPALLSRKWVTLAATGCVLTLTISLVIQMPVQGPWLDESVPERVFTPVDSDMQAPTTQVGESRGSLEEVVVTSAKGEAFLDAEPLGMDAVKFQKQESVQAKERLTEESAAEELEQQAAPKPTAPVASAPKFSSTSALRKRSLADNPSVAEPEANMRMSDMAAPAESDDLAGMVEESATESKKGKSDIEDQTVMEKWSLETWIEKLTTLLRDQENEQALELYEHFLKQYPDYPKSTLLSDKEQKLFKQLDVLKMNNENQRLEK